MDGERIDLPDIESVVVLNIPYWGAGVKPWLLGNGARVCVVCLLICFPQYHVGRGTGRGLRFKSISLT